MKTANRGYIFVISLALLFWNPQYGHPNEKGYEEVANGISQFLTTYFLK